MRVKVLTQGNNGVLCWGSNSRLTGIHRLRVRRCPLCHKVLINVILSKTQLKKHHQQGQYVALSVGFSNINMRDYEPRPTVEEVLNKFYRVMVIRGHTGIWLKCPGPMHRARHTDPQTGTCAELSAYMHTLKQVHVQSYPPDIQTLRRVHVH